MRRCRRFWGNVPLEKVPSPMHKSVLNAVCIILFQGEEYLDCQVWGNKNKGGICFETGLFTDVCNSASHLTMHGV